MEQAVGYAPGHGMKAVDPELRNLSVAEGFAILPFSSSAHGFFAKLQECGAVYQNGQWNHTESFRGNKNWLSDGNGVAYNRLLSESSETGLSVNTLSLRYLTNQLNTIPVMSVSRPEQLDGLENL